MTHATDITNAATPAGGGAFPSRQAFMARVTEALRARLAQRPVVLMIGLDRVPEATACFGYGVAESLITRAEGRVRSVLRTAAAVARMTEHEFGALLTMFPDDAASLGRQLVDVTARPYLLDGRPLIIGCSVGLACATETEASPDALCQQATLALSHARSLGGGRCIWFEPVMAERAVLNANLEYELRRALVLREFELHFQPQVEAVSGKLHGFEALLRWRHPTRGLLSPGDFLAAAEETGLLGPISEWVIRSACQAAAAWPKHTAVGINVDAALVESGRLYHLVEQALVSSGLPAHRLDLEITEGLLLRNDDRVIDTLLRLRQLGAHVSMDDFGTGFSSLTQLRRFPFSKIKIDRSLIAGIGDDTNGAVLVRAITMMGAGLGMRTVAEGVETAAELGRVRAEGCDFVQGYLTGRPMPAAEALALAARTEDE